VALFVYGDVLFLDDPAVRYPWSSDAWGHLIKAEYLISEIGEGRLYPDLFPQWYNGQQMLRYYAPLPYYALAALLPFTSDSFSAGHLFLFIAALSGGLSMLLFSRRFGLLPATVGGILLILMHDNIRVAFAEGNIPRVMASAFLPAVAYFAIELLDAPKPNVWRFAGLAALIALVVITHAMMAAILGACIVLLAAVYWTQRWDRLPNALLAVAAVVTGVLLSGWWILPSLTGGITELNVEAASAGLSSIAWSETFGPLGRYANIESFYIGLAAVFGLLIAVGFWRRLGAVSRALLVTSLVTLTISTTLLNPAYSALPMHQLFWPLRFMSFAGFLAVLTIVALLSVLWNRKGRRYRMERYIAAAMIALFLLDAVPSLRLTGPRDLPHEIAHVSNLLADSGGWRVAAADLSQLGSSPTYLFSTVGGREQVFGWAFQGAPTAPLLGMVNQGIEKGNAHFALSRLDLLGADSLVVLKPEYAHTYPISQEFVDEIPRYGYRTVYEGERVLLYQKEGSPRVYRIEPDVFAVGSASRNLALVFPQVVVGTENAIDAYPLEFLASFDTLILCGFTWNDKGRAEDIVRALSRMGKNVVIDLTGTPVDPVARIPEFLGVYGERVRISNFVSLRFDGFEGRLAPYDTEYSPWQAYVPQGLDSKQITFDIASVQATVAGRKLTGDSSHVTFIGLNLPFHAVLTRDPAAIALLESVTGLDANDGMVTEAVPLTSYKPSEAGYDLRVTAPSSGYYIVPVAHHSGTEVEIDGRGVDSLSVEMLTLVRLEEGEHHVRVLSEPTAIYGIGKAASLTGLLIVAAATVPGLLRRWHLIAQNAPRRSPRAAEPDAAR
jgi:uncharacterized membrane protein